jgi:hypothetical protein
MELEHSDLEILAIIFLLISGISILLFFYLLIRIRFSIKEVFRNMKEIAYRLSILEKNKEYNLDIEKIVRKLREITEGLKRLNNSIK